MATHRVCNTFSLSSMNGVLLFLLLLRMLAEVSAGVLDTYADDATAVQVMHDITNHQLSTRSAPIRSSPECWITSITTTINRWTIGVENNAEGGYQKHVHSSGSSYCASMTNEQQEVLALELTNCQLMKEKRQLFDAKIVNQETDPMEILGDEQHLCMVGRGGVNPYNASSCLPLMSEFALNLYHQIFMHTHDVCTRLTEEMMLQQKEEAAQMLVDVSSAVSQQMQNILDGATTVLEKAQIHSALLEDQSIMMREQKEELQRMHLARKQEEQESMAVVKKQTALLEEQSSMMREQQLESNRLHKAREEAAASTIDQMANQTASFLQEHTEKMKNHQNDIEVAFQTQRKEAAMTVEKMKVEATILIAEQAGEIKAQKRDLERMQEMISNASSQMQQLSRIESYVRLATGGFTVLKALFNFFLTMNIAWMITSMPLLSRGRRYLFGIFALGFLAEIAVVWFADKALIMYSGMADIEIIRDWTRASGIVTLLFSTFVSCFLPPKKDDSSITMDELLKSQMEFVSKLNALSPMETRTERMELPSSAAAKPDKSTMVKFSKERGRSMARMRPEDLLIPSNRNFKPRRHRSRSPYRSSLTDLALPVVTPIKPRAKNNITATATAPRSHEDYQTTYYVHRSDALARQEEESNRLELECVRALQKRATRGASSAQENSSSSSDESSVESSSAKRNKKRTVSEMYASSSEDSNFFSANDEEMSTSSAPSNASPSRVQEKKKCKLTNVHIH